MYEDRDDDQLLEICQSGDYTEKARAEAHRLLLSRGFHDSEILPERDERVYQTPISWNVDLGPDTVLGHARRRRRLYLITARCALWAVIGTPLLALLSLLPVFLGVSAEPLPLDGVSVFSAIVVYSHFVIHAAWRRPARMILLRPFHSRHQRRGLTRLVKRYLRFFGHIYTLEDSTYRGSYGCLPGTGSWIWGDIRLLLAFHVAIHTNRDVWKLQRVVARRTLRNVNWLFSTTKVFAVTVMDEYWRQAIQVLVNTADAIIIDASEDRANVLWEINEIAHYELTARCVIISSATDLATANAAASAVDRAGSCPIFRFDRESGEIEDPDAFLSAVSAAIVKGRSQSQPGGITAP